MACGCDFCWRGSRQHVEETARHFAVCPRFDRLWAAVDQAMDAAGMPLPVRTWFVIYGPESANYRRDQYDTAVWIWAATVAVMLRARQDSQTQQQRAEMTPAMQIAAVKAVLVSAAGAEHAAATSWRVPNGEHGGQWGQRQARTERGWERRWRGLAQIRKARVVWYDSADFDRGAAARLLEHYEEQADWRSRRAEQ